jgi:sterol desaturase/sphingolipid hydroxylase (fatty acid hydroxylase superfamily)
MMTEASLVKTNPSPDRQSNERRTSLDIFAFEHSKTAYAADFALYGATILGLAVFLTMGPQGQRLEIIGFTLAGLGGWTLIEYLLHRFVLHRVQPFYRWHAEHHRRPTALIFAPTILSASLIATLVFLPAFMVLGDLRYACALTLGVLTGYLAFGITHHAIHHWHLDNAWLKRRKHWHAIHHHTDQSGCYGVTSAVWDHVFGSAEKPMAH